MHRTARTLATLAVIFALTATVAACGGSDDEAKGEGKPALTVYNAQHEDLVTAMVAGFTKETGSRSRSATAATSRWPTSWSQEGDRVAGRRLPDRELAGDDARRERRTASRRSTTATLAQVPARYRPSTGDWVGFAARATVFVYNTDDRRSARAAGVDHGSRRPEVEGQGRLLARRAPTSRRSSARCSSSRARTRPQAWLKGLKANGDGLPGQRRGDEGRRRRARSDAGDHLPLLLVPGPGRDGREQRQRQAALLRQPGPGRVRQRLRRRRARSPASTAARRRSWSST